MRRGAVGRVEAEGLELGDDRLPRLLGGRAPGLDETDAVGDEGLDAGEILAAESACCRVAGGLGELSVDLPQLLPAVELALGVGDHRARDGLPLRRELTGRVEPLDRGVG